MVTAGGLVAVAEELVEHYPGGEQAGGDVPAGEVGVGWLVGGVRDWVRTRSPTREAMLKSSSSAPARWSKSFSVELFLESSGSGGPAASAVPLQ